MTLSLLNSDERIVVRRSMEATFQFFDTDFETRLGVNPEEMKSLLRDWPNVDDSSDNSIATLAINNSLNDLLHGFDISDTQAQSLVGTNRSEMDRVYTKWAKSRGWSSTGIR